MSTKYFCDACDKEVRVPENLNRKSIPSYSESSGISEGTAWSGELCSECQNIVEREEANAALRTIKAIMSKNKNTQ